MPGSQNVSKPSGGEHRPGALPPSGPKAHRGQGRRSQLPQGPHIVAEAPESWQEKGKRAPAFVKPAQQKVAPPQQDAASSYVEEAPFQDEVAAPPRDITDKDGARQEDVGLPRDITVKDESPHEHVGSPSDSTDKANAPPQPDIASPKDTKKDNVSTATNGAKNTSPYCLHSPCTKLGCEFKHFDDKQQVPPPCYHFHGTAEGCKYGSYCQYFHYTKNQEGNIDHHHYVFSEPKRTIHVENNGKLETKEVDNRAQELFTVLNYHRDTFEYFNICPEHFSGLKHQSDGIYHCPKAMSESMQHYYDCKRDQRGDEHKPVWELCPYDHSVQDISGSLYLPRPRQSKSEVHSWENEPLNVDPSLVDFCGGPVFELLARDIDFDLAQACLDFGASEAAKQLAFEKAAEEAAEKAAKATAEEAAKKAVEKVVEKVVEKIALEWMLKEKKAMLPAKKDNELPVQKKEGPRFKVKSVAGIKRKFEDISNPESAPASVKKLSLVEDSSPASTPSTRTPPADATPAANSATDSPTAVVTPAASSPKKRKFSNDDDQKSVESGRNKKMRRDVVDVQSQIQNGIRLRHQRQRKAEASVAPASTTSNKRKQVDEEEPSAPGSATSSKKRKLDDDEETPALRSATTSNNRERDGDDMPGSNESGSNKKPHLSPLSNESSASRTPSPEPFPVFSKAGSPVSSASSAPSPPPAPTPTPSPAPIPSKAGASKSGSSSPAVTSPYPPMPKCPVGVRMSMREYRNQLRRYNDLKAAGEAKAGERRNLRSLLIRSIKLHGLDEPDPVGRAKIYRSLKGGPEWDPC